MGEEVDLFLQNPIYQNYEDEGEDSEEGLLTHKAKSLPTPNHREVTPTIESPNPPRTTSPPPQVEDKGKSRLVDYPDSPTSEWANLHLPTSSMALPNSTDSLKHIMLTPEKPQMPTFSVEAQAGSNHQQQKEEHEYA